MYLLFSRGNIRFIFGGFGSGVSKLLTLELRIFFFLFLALFELLSQVFLTFDECWCNFKYFGYVKNFRKISRGIPFGILHRFSQLGILKIIISFPIYFEMRLPFIIVKCCNPLFCFIFRYESYTSVKICGS